MKKAPRANEGRGITLSVISDSALPIASPVVRFAAEAA
jgi:hypothetical protein